MAKKNFPKMLYVKTEEDAGTKYFVADDSMEAIAEVGEKIHVALYQLVEVSNVELVVKIIKSK